MSSPIDLVGLPYVWRSRPDEGGTDCFQLACWVLRHYGEEPPDFEWVYDRYTEDTVRGTDLLRWCQQSLSLTETPPKLGVACFHSQHGAGLATIAPCGVYLINREKRVAWINRQRFSGLLQKDDCRYFRINKK